MTSRGSARSVGIVLLATLAGIGALYVGREFFIPIALALLLHALLRPVVRGLEGLRVPTAVGATLVVVGLLGVLGAGGFVLVDPVRSWVSQLPASFEVAARKLETARHSLEQVSQATQALTEPGGAPTGAPAAPAVPGTYLVITTLQNNLVSPLVYGQRLQLNVRWLVPSPAHDREETSHGSATRPR